jgi:CheY-like chemotaxis protein
MKGKILVVEDEPVVALDLQQEIEQLGLTVVGLA